MIFAVWLSGCVSDFTGDEGKVEFASTLSRQSVRWTPQQPVAVGEHFGIRPWDPPCVLICSSTYSLDGGFVDDGGVLALEDGGAVVAMGEGTGVLHFMGRDADQVTIQVKPVEQVRLSDPLVLNARDWPRLLVTDAGPLPPVFPDVGDEVVMGEDAGLFLEVIPLDDAGQLMGVSRGGFAISGGGPGVNAAAGRADDRLLDLHSGGAGAHAQLTVSLADGGHPRQYEVRVAPASEVRALALFSAVDSFGSTIIIRAVAQREDGGVFFEPPIDWVLPAGAIEFPYAETSAFTLRRRRDVLVLNSRLNEGGDGGVHQVVARVGGVEATLEVTLAPPVEDPVQADGGVVAGPPRGCGCSSGAGAVLGLVLPLLLRRRRRA
jgi:hypothetical protein